VTPEALFKAAASGKLPSNFLLRGGDAYLTRELKKLLKAAAFEIDERELKRTGPGSEASESASGLSLFRVNKVLWLKAISPPSAWSKDGLWSWKELLRQADGESLVVLLQVEADKRLKWDSLGLDESIDWNVDASKFSPWIKRMNESRGAPLSNDKLSFLAGMEAELLQIDNWIELWSLGNDLWAERALGWGTVGGQAANSVANPAFAWVDAVLAGRRREALSHWKLLLGRGEEPRQLLALASKSIRILATLEAGRRPTGQPDFLVQKLQALRSRLRPGHGKRLLKLTAEIDRMLKTSSAREDAVLALL